MKKKKKKFSKMVIVLVLVQVFAYTWVHLILSLIAGIELAPTMTCGFYAFCGAEAGLLAWIRKLDKSDKPEGTEDITEREEKPYERDYSEKAVEP